MALENSDGFPPFHDCTSIPIRKAARIVRDGGVVAYPTEGVFGLGCRPDDTEAVARILRIKGRDPAMGLILIAADDHPLQRWVDLPDGRQVPASSLERPVTWIVPARIAVPASIRGRHTTVAVRITAHPVAAALCRAAESALVSTSANFSGQRPARNIHVLRRNFGALVDCIVPGACGPAAGPSEIRDLLSGTVLRSAG
jgi:L-threonylcarbamoyladenylate synthase